MNQKKLEHFLHIEANEENNDNGNNNMFIFKIELGGNPNSHDKKFNNHFRFWR